MSNDFGRFWTLVLNRLPVLYTTDKDFGRIRYADHRTFGRQKYPLMERFENEHWLFLDPANVVNTEYDEIVPKPNPMRCDGLRMPPPERFQLVRKTVEDTRIASGIRIAERCEEMLASLPEEMRENVDNSGIVEDTMTIPEPPKELSADAKPL